MRYLAKRPQEGSGLLLLPLAAVLLPLSAAVAALFAALAPEPYMVRVQMFLVFVCICGDIVVVGSMFMRL